MAITKSKKQDIVSSFSDILSNASSVVFVKFDKLTVKSANEFRRKLRASGVGYKVGKKSLLKRVLDTQGYSGTMPELIGEIGIAYSNDLLAPSREVYDFQKTNKEVIDMLGGMFDKEYKDKATMIGMANIPSLHALRGMFVNVINSPVQRFVTALDAIAKKKVQ